jgi:DnaJ-class molecular chaperone
MSMKVKRKIVSKIKTECRYCDGCGWTEGGKTLQTNCPICHGKGYTETKSYLKIKPKE